MRRFFVEDAAHDAVLKILNYGKGEILICNGRANTITQACNHKGVVALIDRDVEITHSKLKGAEWKPEDDFTYSLFNGNLFICFTKNVDDWLIRISAEIKVKPSDFKLPQEVEMFHGRIKSTSNEARKFLQEVSKPKNSPLKLLRERIRKHLKEKK